MTSRNDAEPRADAAQALRRLFWRLHFWAGLTTAPLVLFAALTGLLYVFTPQIEARVHAHLDHVDDRGPALSLDTQLAAARGALPRWTARSVLPAAASGDTTQVLFAPPPQEHRMHAGAEATGGDEHGHGLPSGRIVYLNPATAEVLGSLDEMARFKTWAKKLHSSFLQGDAWRWPIELAASWMLLMFATGLALWWPQGRLVLRFGRGRLTWRDVHTGLGVLMGGVLAVVLITGLTWSRNAGDHFRAAQQALDQASPKPPRDLRSQAARGAAPLGLQAVVDRSRQEIAVAPLAITLPRASAGNEPGLWRVDVVAGDDPAARRALVLDGGTGQVLWRSGWAELPALAKATAVGIPFHRAELGVWNQALLALAALAAIGSVISGFAMWWIRRPARSIGAPSMSRGQLRAVPAWLWVVAAVLAYAMPVFGLSLVAFIAVELLAFAVRRSHPLLTA